MEPQLRGVAKTALGAAVMRARESLRPDRLFDDPCAQRFVDAAPGAFPEEPARTGESSLGEVFSFHVVVRTRFFDDYLITAAAAGCRQVVLLAAGLDSRAFRLPWPDGVRVFELDLPEVFAFKEAVLDAAPNCERAVVPVDLRENWAAELVAAGFDRTTPTAWLAEGLLLYLTATEAARLLTEAGDLSAPDSRLSFEHGSTALLTQVRQMPTMDQYTALWKGGLGEDAPDWLRRHRWHPQLHDRAQLAASYGRPAPKPSTGGFLTALRVGR